MNILYLHKFNLNTGWGGSATMLKALHAALRDLGHEVDVATPKRPDRFGMTTIELPITPEVTFGPETRPGEICLDAIDSGGLRAIADSCAASVAAGIDGKRFDLIVANHINLMALVAARVGGALGVPYRIISFGTDTQLLLRHARLRELFGPAAVGADRIFAISHFVAREVAEAVGGRVEALGGAVDQKLFYREPGSPPAAKRIIFMGRLVTEKGLWPLLEAFRLQTAAQELHILGEGPLREPLLARIAELGLQDRVRLLGYARPEALREHLRKAALAVVPSTWEEPLGLVVLEALACGLPVVATAVGGIPEILEDGVTGVLVPPADPRALADAIDRVLGNDAEYRRMVDAVCARAVPSYHDLAGRVISS